MHDATHGLVRAALAIILLGIASCQSDSSPPPSCTSGTTMCGSACFDTNVDPNNCGGCGLQCPSAMACNHGKCTSTCDVNQTMCLGLDGNHCVGTMTDNDNCGGCGIVCGAQQVCSAGVCSSTCIDSQALCEPQGGHAYCAMLATDTANCGTCGKVCDSSLSCVAGHCVPACSAAQTSCVDQNATAFCTDLANDPNNCGSCAHACGTSGYCSMGQCACAGSQTWCGACTDTQSDANNCGFCFDKCSSGMCSRGKCIIDTGVYTSFASALNLVVDDSDVFYSNSAWISSIPNGGGTSSSLTLGYSPIATVDSLALDATNVYFIDGGPSGSRICKVKKTGGAVTVLASASDDLMGLAVDATNVYAHGPNGIYSVPVMGGALSTIASGDGLNYGTPSIVSDGTTLYWTQGNDLVSMPVGGGTISTLYTGQSLSWLVPVRGTYLQLLFTSQNILFELQPPSTSALPVALGVENVASSPYVVYFGAGLTLSKYNGMTTPLVDTSPDPEIAASSFYLTWFSFGRIYQLQL